MKQSKKLVEGIGINDSNYNVTKEVMGKQIWYCPFYMTWKSMVFRCYNIKYHRIQKTYIGCSVCETWLTFSNFKMWMEKQNWQGNELDKDLLVEGNKVYSPDTCIFIGSSLNAFLGGCSSAKGKYLLGVSFVKRLGKFRAQCNDGKGRQLYLGLYADELSAHLAWKAHKHKVACRFADDQTDTRVSEALRVRYL